MTNTTGANKFINKMIDVYQHKTLNDFKKTFEEFKLTFTEIIEEDYYTELEYGKDNLDFDSIRDNQDINFAVPSHLIILLDESRNILTYQGREYEIMKKYRSLKDLKYLDKAKDLYYQIIIPVEDEKDLKESLMVDCNQDTLKNFRTVLLNIIKNHKQTDDENNTSFVDLNSQQKLDFIVEHILTLNNILLDKNNYLIDSTIKNYINFVNVLNKDEIYNLLDKTDQHFFIDQKDKDNMFEKINIFKTIGILSLNQSPLLIQKKNEINSKINSEFDTTLIDTAINNFKNKNDEELKSIMENFRPVFGPIGTLSEGKLLFDEDYCALSISYEDETQRNVKRSEKRYLNICMLESLGFSITLSSELINKLNKIVHDNLIHKNIIKFKETILYLLNQYKANKIKYNNNNMNDLFINLSNYHKMIFIDLREQYIKQYLLFNERRYGSYTIKNILQFVNSFPDNSFERFLTFMGKRHGFSDEATSENIRKLKYIKEISKPYLNHSYKEEQEVIKASLID